MKNLIIFFIISSLCFNLYASKNVLKDKDKDKEISGKSTRSFDLQIGEAEYLNGIALGVLASALHQCEGKDVPDKTVIETAGAVQLTGEVSDYEELKELQERAHKYEKTKYDDVNDSQKLALTSEQYVDNKRMIKILKGKLSTQKAVRSAYIIAKGIALKELHEMKGYLTKCKKAIYDGAYKPIWLPKKQKWCYGQCEKDWGDSNWTGEVLCPNYEKAEAEYQAASGPDKAKYKDAKNAAFDVCNMCAMATADMSRMYVGTGAVCSERCILAANEIMDCNRALKMVNTGGIPLINKLAGLSPFSDAKYTNCIL